MNTEVWQVTDTQAWLRASTFGKLLLYRTVHATGIAPEIKSCSAFHFPRKAYPNSLLPCQKKEHEIYFYEQHDFTAVLL